MLAILILIAYKFLLDWLKHFNNAKKNIYQVYEKYGKHFLKNMVNVVNLLPYCDHFLKVTLT